jgi:hypothetical protein
MAPERNAHSTTLSFEYTPGIEDRDTLRDDFQSRICLYVVPHQPKPPGRGRVVSSCRGSPRDGITTTNAKRGRRLMSPRKSGGRVNLDRPVQSKYPIERTPVQRVETTIRCGCVELEMAALRLESDDGRAIHRVSESLEYRLSNVATDDIRDINPDRWTSTHTQMKRS